jgi:hypothetical protein
MLAIILFQTSFEYCRRFQRCLAPNHFGIYKSKIHILKSPHQLRTYGLILAILKLPSLGTLVIFKELKNFLLYFWKTLDVMNARVAMESRVDNDGLCITPE